MAKELKFDIDARDKIMQGVNTVTDAVKITLGPSGRNVLISKGNGSVTITKDGVSVCKSIDLEDEFINQGAQLIKDVASKTVDQVGDGTTTSCILAQAIAREGLKTVAAGANPMEIKLGIDKTVDALIEELNKNAIKVKDKSAVAQVGIISANGDTEIGNLIADAVDRVGEDGVITVEESKTAETTLDVVEGMQFNNGYLSPYFVTNPEKMECVLENPFVLLVNHKISVLQDMINMLEYVNQQGRPLLIIAEDVDSEALAALVMNKLRGVLRVAAVKAPGYGDSRMNNLKDLAVITAGELIADELGIKLSEADPVCLGSAKTVKITKDHTTIIEGAGAKEDIDALVTQLKNQIATTES